MKKSQFGRSILSGALIVFFSLLLPRSQAASGEKLDLEVYPSVWTVTASNSGLNLIAVKGKNGFSGPVTVTVSGLPDNILDHSPSTAEAAAGKGGYYCTSHCQAASNSDFPVALSVSDGQWTSFGPTLQTGTETPTATSTVTITATGGGTSVSQSFTLKTIDNETTIDPHSGELIPPADKPNPNGYLTINNAQFGANAYKINVTAGQSATANVDVQNDDSDPITLTLLSNLTSSGIANGVSSTIIGGFSQESISLAGRERKTIPFSFSTQSTTINGTYELMMGVAQTDGSNRATWGISTIITGGASGVTPTSTTVTTSATATASTTTTTHGPTSSSPPPSVSSSETASPTATTESPANSSASPSPSETVVSIVPSVNSSPTVRVLARTVTQDIFVPTALGGVAVAVVTLATSVIPLSMMGTSVGAATMVTSYLLMLWNGLLEAIGLRRRRYPWGTVFEAGTDRPLELVIVRLKAPDGRLLETRVTDRSGRFGFLAKPGRYVTETIKSGYQLATKFRAAGSRFQPVLTKPELTIGKNAATIRANIPLEPIEKSHRRLPLAQWLGVLHRPALFVSLPLGVWNYAVLPTTVNLLVLAVLGFVLASQWLILTPRFFGLVSGPTYQFISGVVLQLIRHEDGKVVATQVTDEFGRYHFLALLGSYQIRVASPEWRGPDWLAKKVFQITDPAGGLIAPWLALRSNQEKDL